MIYAPFTRDHQRADQTGDNAPDNAGCLTTENLGNEVVAKDCGGRSCTVPSTNPPIQKTNTPPPTEPKGSVVEGQSAVVFNPQSEDANTEKEMIERANNGFGIRQLIDNILTSNRAASSVWIHNIKPSSDNRSWTDAASAMKGDAVELLARSEGLERSEAAAGIVQALELLSEDERCIVAPEVDFDPEAKITANFPANCLPEPMRTMVTETAKLEGVDIALASTVFIGAASAASGNNLMAESKADKNVRANLFIFVSAESGTGKTGVGTRAFGPLRAFQSKLNDAAQALVPNLRAKLTLVERQLKKLGASTAQTQPELDEEVVHLTALEEQKRALEAKLEPVTIVTSDVTSQKALEIMSRNGGALAIHSSDGRSIAGIIGGRHEKGSSTDDALLVSAYSVDEDTDQHRITRANVTVRRPCISLVILIQPDIFQSFWKNDALVRGGLLARCLTAKFKPTYAKVQVERMEYPRGVAEAYNDCITELLETYRMHEGSPFVVKASREAREIIIGYGNRTTERLREGELLSEEGPFAARWAENAWRMALVFHAVEHGKNAHNVEMTAETARNAVGAVSWFAIRQLEILDTKRQDEADERFAKVLTLAGRHPHLTVSMVTKAKCCITPDEAEDVLDTLVRNGTLVKKPFTGHGRPTVRYSRPVKP